MITVAGLGPGDFDRIPLAVQSALLDDSVTLVCRTRHHPAAAHLATLREVVFCDDLYESRDSFDAVYEAIVGRVLAAGETGQVVYAVPGSPRVGEFAVRGILDSGVPVEMMEGESFVDAILAEVGYDPLDRGLQILNGHDLPDPLILDKPTIVAQVDSSGVLADVATAIDRVVSSETRVMVLVDLGSAGGRVVETEPSKIPSELAGQRTSLFIDAVPGGLVGAVRTMRRLRQECPWDMEQTHASLTKNLIEEAFELIEAIGRLPQDEIDWVAYAAVEDELGDVLLQVLFHATIARQAGAFDIDDVAEVLRQKLVRRHPHVFGDVEANSVEEVKANWDRIKEAERGKPVRSVLDGVPAGMPAVHRAAKLQNRASKAGFDRDEMSQMIPRLREDVDALEAVLGKPGLAAGALGELLFSAIDLARHLGTDGELVLSGAIHRFEDRFRRMEQGGPITGLTSAELNDRWKRAERED